MKKDIIAVLLSIAMAVGSIGAPALSVQATTAEAAAEEEAETAEAEEEAETTETAEAEEEAEPEAEAEPEDAASEEAEPEDAAPEEAEPEDAAPEEAEPEDAAPEEAEPEDTAPEKEKPEGTESQSEKVADSEDQAAVVEEEETLEVSEEKNAKEAYGGAETSTENEDSADDTNTVEITLNKSTATIVKGKTLQLVAEVTPEDASYGEVTWKSDQIKVATVDKKGKVTAVSAGTAKIAASIGNGSIKAVCTIKVVNPYTIKFNKNATKATLTTTSKKVNPGSKMGTMPTPKYSGYYFLGWYTAKTGGTKITASTKPSKSMTLYAHWVLRKSIKKATVKVASCMYKAAACKPAVTVKLGTKTLTKDVDYSVTYSNNIAVGSKAVVKITGKGKYKDSISKTFTINKCSMDAKYISAKLSQTAYDYSGKAKTPTITVYLNGKYMLKKGTDYKVSYKNNIEPGKATVQITGMGSFVSKSRYFTFTINKLNQPIRLSKTSLSLPYNSIGATYDVTATNVKESAGLTVSSTNQSVATVSGSNGKYKIKIKGVGKANIEFKTNKATKHYKVTTKKLSVTVVDDRKNPTITLPQKTYDLYYGDDAFNLGAECDGDGALTYTSSDTDIVTVDEFGTVSIVGDKEGTASITITSQATKKYKKGTAKVSIKLTSAPDSIYVESIELSESTLRLYEGRIVRITSTVTPENANYTELSWTSSNEDVASVDNNGYVTALAEGEAVITAEAMDGSGVKAECEVTVVHPETTVTGIELDHEELELTVGEELTLVATVEPDDATEKGLVWESSDESIATVDENGCVVAVGEGYAWITANTIDGTNLSAECSVYVSLPGIKVTEIKLDHEDLELTLNEEVTLVATVEPDDATEKELKWKSSNENVAVVDQYGSVGGVSVGEATITASATDGSGVTAECIVRVVPAVKHVEEIELSQNSLRLLAGDTMQISAVVAPDDASNPALLWSSSNEDIAAVDENGLVTALAEGQTVITAEAQDGSGVKTECEVTVLSAGYTNPIDDFTFKVLNGTYCSITGYTGTDSVINIPEMDADGHYVQSIGSSAFEGKTFITKVVVSNRVTSIGKYAFFNCTSLRSIYGGQSLEDIGEHAFSGCSSLTDVDLDENLETIQEYAFEDCASLNSIHLPDSITGLSHNVFDGCKNLSSVNYPTGWNEKIGYSNYQNATWPSPFTNCVNLKKMEVPEGVVTIPEGAFTEMTSLTEITLPSTLKNIGERAFMRCSGLSEITLPASLRSIGDCAFEECTGFTEIELPAKIVDISKYCFNGCTNLADVNLPENLETIQEYAFEDCTSLKSIHLPDSITGLSNNVFDGCKKLSNVNYPMGWNEKIEYSPYQNATWPSPFTNCVNLKKMEVPEGVVTIPEGAFTEMTSLTEITLPSTLKNIGERAFMRCSGLSEITLPASLRSIGDCAFEECTGFTEIELPAKIVDISKYCFSGCTNLTDVNLPENLETIQEYAFEDCTSLKSIHLPDSITGLSNNVFDGCKKLSNVNYPMGWNEKIEYSPYQNATWPSPFTNCVNLKKMEVPEGVETIPASAFTEMTSVTNLTLPSTLKTIEEIACMKCTGLGWTYFPVSINSIADDAFDEFGEDLTMESEYGAYVIEYAKSKGIPYYYLSLTGSNLPGGTLYQGYSFNMYGYVRSTVNITEITATIKDSSGVIVRSNTVEPNVTDYNLAGGFASALSLSTLPLGEYTFTLSATTNETSETFVSRDFSVVEAPLMVNLTGYSLHSGVIVQGESKPVTGTLSTNYPITRVAVRVLPDGGSAEDISTASPNAESYELGSLGANMSSLEEGDFTVSIIVEGHGETREVGIVDLCVGNGGLPSGSSINDSAFAEFVNDESNKEYWMNQFPGIVSYQFALMNAAGSDPWTGMSVYFENYDDYSKNFVEDLFTGKLDGFKSETFYVDMAKTEIKSLIEDLGTSGFAEYSYDKTLSEKAGSAFIKGSKLTSEMFKDSAYALQPYDEQFISDWNETAKGLGDAYKIISTCEEVSEILVNCTMDFSQGMAVLDGLENSCPYTGEYNKYYLKAIEELRWEFSGYITNAISRVMNYAKEKMVDEGLDKLTEEMLGVYSKSYSLANLFWKAVGNYGVYDGGKEYINYLMRMQSYINAEKNYEEAFQAILDGDTSTVAKARLASRFELTRRCAVRALLYMQTMEGSYMDKMDMTGVAELEYTLEYKTKCPFLN